LRAVKANETALRCRDCSLNAIDHLKLKNILDVDFDRVFSDDWLCLFHMFTAID